MSGTIRFFLLIFLLLSCKVYGQHSRRHFLGGYTIKNYTAKDYNMHPRNLYITQDERGILYFGNVYGIMEYDGNYWLPIHLTNGTSGFSLNINSEGRMHIGSTNELGYLGYDSSGTSVYRSLCDKIPEAEKTIENIWETCSSREAVVFFSASKILIWKNQRFQFIYPEDSSGYFQYAKKIGETIYVQESGKGLRKLEGDQLRPVAGGYMLNNIPVVTLLPYLKDQLLVVTPNNIFRFGENGLSPFLAPRSELFASTLSHALILPDGNLLIATEDNGFYIVDSTGEVLKNINVKNGLQSNHINYAFLDREENLWLALDNGIAHVEINSPFTFLDYAYGVPGMGFGAAVFENKLYLATSRGLFYTDWDQRFVKNSFKPVKGISGQVWSISVVDHTLMCCQGNRLFQVKNDQVVAIPGGNTAYDNWNFSLLKSRPGYAIKGTHAGFEIYTLQNGTWKYLRRLKGFEESCRIFSEDKEGIIWMCHGNKGVYKIILSEDLEHIISAENYNHRGGFPPDFFIDVSIVNNRVVFASQKGVYCIAPTGKQFEKDTVLENLFGKDLYIDKIIQDNEGNIWLFSENDLTLYRKNKTGLFRAEDEILHRLSGSLVGSYEFVLPLTTTLSVIGSQDGFVLFDRNYQNRRHKIFSALVRKIEANFRNDSILFGGSFTQSGDLVSTQQNSIKEWEYTLNSLRISFSAPFYEGTEKIQYQYALSRKGSDEKYWSGWTNTTQVVLSNLSEGEYVFSLRAKNIYGTLSTETSYAFRILPPWYRSILAYTLYSIICMIAVILLAKYVLTRFRKQRELLEEQKHKELDLMEQEHLTEILRKEKELIAIRNQQLEEKMVLKNNELASLATLLNQKTELLVHLKEKFKEIEKDEEKPDSKVFKDVIKNIDQHFDLEDNWSNFQIHFDKVHHNFLQRLKEKHPKLDQSWLLLCAYIRMNKSNKEIAFHMNISVAAVEKRRYRLKDKLNLDNDSKLVDYILHF